MSVISSLDIDILKIQDGGWTPYWRSRPILVKTQQWLSYLVIKNAKLENRNTATWINRSIAIILWSGCNDL